MLPIGKGPGELWKGGSLLCKVEYEISEPLTIANMEGTQHVKMLVKDYDCETLLTVAGLTLILADGSRQRLPRPINLVNGDGQLECFISAAI